MRHRNDQFEEIFNLIKNYDSSDDAIVQAMKLKEISKCFTKSVTDEKKFSDLFDFLNTKALQDESFVTKFVAVVTSRQLETFAINGKLVRNAVLDILQKNFQSAANFKRDDMSKFYNSIKLLGEYFNKARNMTGSPINIIGQSLLSLLNVELEKELKSLLHFKTDDFSEIILTQFALNGNLLKIRHKTEIELVLVNVRKSLIEISSLSSKSKAFLLMTLDLYYANFNESNIGSQLEKIYQGYLLENSNENTATVINNSKTSSPPTSSGINAKVSHTQSQTRSVDERASKTQSNGKLHQQITSKRSEKPSSNDKRTEKSTPQKSPVKNIPPRLPQTRRSEPIIQRSVTPTSRSYSYNIHSQSSPQKRISPKELRTRQSIKSSPPILQQKPTTSQSSKSSFKVESAIDKLQIETPSDIKQSSNQQQLQLQSQETPPTSPTKIQSTNNEENILKQQNTNGYSLNKARGTNNKVYFKEENVENLSWNGETSFEFDDPELASSEAQSPKPNQYSSSFLNFLSNN